LAWEKEPGSGDHGRHRNGQLKQSSAEDERLLDHHIEEILGTLIAAKATRESAPETREDQL
jgi:hypothetical protein